MKVNSCTMMTSNLHDIKMPSSKNSNLPLSLPPPKKGAKKCNQLGNSQKQLNLSRQRLLFFNEEKTSLQDLKLNSLN